MLSGPAWRCAFTRSFSIAIHEKQSRDPPSPDERPSLVRQCPVCGLPEPLSRFGRGGGAARKSAVPVAWRAFHEADPAAGAVHPGRFAGRDGAFGLRACYEGARREHRGRQPAGLRRTDRDPGGRARYTRRSHARPFDGRADGHRARASREPGLRSRPQFRAHHPSDRHAACARRPSGRAGEHGEGVHRVFAREQGEGERRLDGQCDLHASHDRAVQNDHEGGRDAHSLQRCGPGD